MGTTDPLVYASVAFWEYGCCGELPVPGAHVSGTLSASPAAPSARFVTTQPFEWVDELELLRFDEWSAHWDRRDGDPTTQPISLRLSWHDDSGGAHPSVTGTVLETYEASLDPGTDEQNTGEVQYLYRQVEDIERRPVNFDARFLCLVVGFAPESWEEPTATAIADHAAWVEEDSRKIHVIGPATAFGTTVPDRDDSVQIDLSDARLHVTRNRTQLNGVVGGIAKQVSRGVPAQNGMFTMLTSVTPGAASSSIDEELFLVVLVDRTHFS